MVRTRLEITDISLPFAEQIPVSINYNIADIREPDKFKSSFSKTINLIGTSEINLIFENIFEVNVATQYFNKNRKSKVKYFVDNIKNFEGDLQLMQIKINPDNSIVYECSIKGEGGSLFTDIGEYYITGNADTSKDLDFTAYNHTFDRTTQIAKRANAGLGYDCIYGHVENGTNGGSEVVFEPRNFVPMFTVREYVKKIIELTGRTYTSTILDSAEFRNHVVYPNVLNIGLSQSQIDNKQFYCGLNADYTLTNGTTYVVALPNETAPFFDIGNQGFAGNTYFTLNSNGNYNIVASDKTSILITHTDPTVTSCQIVVTQISSIRKSSDGGATWFTIATLTTNIVSIGDQPLIGTTYYKTNEIATGSQFFAGGDQFEHRVYYVYTVYNYYVGAAIYSGAGTGTIVSKLLSGSTGTAFFALLSDKTIADGDTLNCNLALPNKIKQKDFLKSVISAFKLQIDIDKTNSTNLIIETFDVFHAGAILNYENKTDLDKEQTNNINTLDAKTYNFTYKNDSDFYNTLYQNKYNEAFGTENIVTDNDFSKEVKKTELIFSGTPNVANYALGIAVPKIFKKEGSTISPIVPNIRLLTCGGVKTSKNYYTYNGFGLTPLVTDQYLYVGHTDDPFSPTYDLNFGILKEAYYTFIGAYFTTNNLYNRYSRNYILNISDRDAKFISKYLWVTAKDLSEFTFRNRLFIDKAYYSVNKIENYTPLDETSTKYELIKLLYTSAYTPTTHLFSDTALVPSGGDVSTDIPMPDSTMGLGTASSLRSTNTLGIGNNIISPPSANNILVMGDNVLVPDGATNFFQINDIYYPKIIGLGSDIKTITGATYNVQKFDSTLLVNGLVTGTVITIAFPTDEYVFENAEYYTHQNLKNRTIGKQFTFVKTDANANNITITSTGKTINGAVNYIMAIQDDAVTIQYDGANWVVINDGGGKLQPNDNFQFVDSIYDLPYFDANTVLLKDNVTYFICSEIDLVGARIICGQNTTIIGGSSENCSLKSTGLSSSTALITSAWSLPIRNITIEHGTAISLDATANANQALDWFGVNFTNCAIIGTVKNYSNFVMNDSAFLNSQGLTFDGSFGTIAFGNTLFDNRTSGTMITLPATATITRRFRIIYSSFVCLSGETGINVNASATIPEEKYILDTVNFSGGGTYLTGVTDASNKALFVACVGITNTNVNGQLYMQGNATVTTVASANVFYKVLGTTTASTDNQKYLHSNNRLTNDAIIPRKFLIQCSLSFTSGSNNVCQFGFYDSVLSTVRTPSKTKSTSNGSGRAENVSFNCVVTHKQGDYLEIRAANTTGANNITVTDMNFVITEIK